MKVFGAVMTCLVVLTFSSQVFAASAFYRLKAEPDRRDIARTFLASMKAMCSGFREVGGHRETMIQQRESATDYTPVAENYGFVDVATGATITEAVAEAAFLELDSMNAAASAAILQSCARFNQ